MSFHQYSVTYYNMAIYCSTLKHNAQYSIDPYVSPLKLNMYSVGYTHRLSIMLLDYVSLIDTKLSNFIYHVQFGNLKSSKLLFYILIVTSWLNIVRISLQATVKPLHKVNLPN